MSNQSRTSSAGYGLYRAGWAMTGLAIAFLLMDASMKLLALPVVLQAQAELGFEGELQVASFHPRYQFAGTGAQDIENYTNRSPYPMLHLLREASVARAVANFPNIERIGATNQEMLRRLGHEGWRQLWIN